MTTTTLYTRHPTRNRAGASLANPGSAVWRPSLCTGKYLCIIALTGAMAACDGSNNDTSTTATPTAPKAPSAPSLTTPSANQISLSWDAVANTVTRYEIHRHTSDDSASATQVVSSASITRHIDTALAPNTTYYYWLKACNTLGCSAFSPVANATTSAPVTVTPPAAPGAPTLVADSVSQISLSWTATSNATRYEVHRHTSDDSASASQLAIGASITGTGYVDTALTPNTTYYYWLKACNAGGCSAFGLVANATTTAAVAVTPPAAPGAPTLVADSTSQITLSWTATSGTTHYEVHRHTSNTSASASQLAIGASITGAGYVDTALAPNTTYYYWLKACNTAGCSAFGPNANATTTAAVAVTPPAAPGAPTLVADSVSQITLSWTATSGATHYEVHRHTSDDSASASQLAIGASITGTGYVDTALTPNTTYYYWLKTCNAGGCSAFGLVANATTTAAVAVTPPAAPGAPTLVADSASQITLSWTATSGTTHYEVHRHTSNTSASASQLAIGASITGTGYVDTALTRNTTYYYWLKACNAGGCSVFSASATIATANTATIPTVENIAPVLMINDQAGGYSFIVNTPIFNIAFINAGGNISSCTSSPTLPTGLSINTRSCTITGIPTEATDGQDYEITATNSMGTDTANLSISVSIQSALVISVFPQNLVFSWVGSTNESHHHYRLQQNPDGQGFTNIETAGSITETSFNWIRPPHQLDWSRARYKVQTCNEDNTSCTDLAEASLRSSASIDAISYLKATQAETEDGFGISVSLSHDGGTLVVGAAGEDGGGGIGGNQTDNTAEGSGAVYVYARDGAAWAQQSYIKAANTDAGDAFGTDVSLSQDGGTLAVGAPGEDGNATGIDGVSDNNTALGAGAVYLFERGDGGWVQQAYIKASNTDAGDAFGTSVALNNNGTLLVVGAPGEDSNAIGINGASADDTASNAGATYVFARPFTVDSAGLVTITATWAQQAYIKASNTDAGDAFGTTVALSFDDSTLAVGAPSEASAATTINGDESNDTATNSGAVYVFLRTGTTTTDPSTSITTTTYAWAQQAYIKAANADAGDVFGTTAVLNFDGSTLAVGAPGEASTATGIGGDATDDTATNSGAVYVFLRTGTTTTDPGTSISTTIYTWAQQAYIKASNTDAGDAFGAKLALSTTGSILAVGASMEDSSTAGISGNPGSDAANDAGAVYTYTRSGTDWSAQNYIKASNTNAGDGFGGALALSGNGNALAVGANGEDGSVVDTRSDPTDNNAINAGAVYVYAQSLEGSVRLSDGSLTRGRVEFFYQGEWGTVCDDQFGVEEATVVCRQLGFPNGVAITRSGSSGVPIVPGSGVIWLDDLMCTGMEEGLIACPPREYGINNCGHNEDVSAECTN